MQVFPKGLKFDDILYSWEEQAVLLWVTCGMALLISGAFKSLLIFLGLFPKKQEILREKRIVLIRELWN